VPRAGKFDVSKAKENGVPMPCWSRLQKGETVILDGITYTPDMVLGDSRKGLKLTYCTDSRPVSNISDHAKEADLFICEGMYGEEGKEKKAREYKHMTFYEAANLAKTAGVAEMWLTHYSPSLVKPEPYMDKVRSIFPNAKAGKDRKSCTLMFEND
jgi:ribonuclease Z